MSLKVWHAVSVHTTTQLEIFKDTNSDQQVKLTPLFMEIEIVNISRSTKQEVQSLLMNWRLAKQTPTTLGTLNSRGKISFKFCAESAFKGNNVFVTAAMLKKKKNTLCTCNMYNILIAMKGNHY
jgi:hypothetical protein